jgi:uncharacterized RDD family membrane protein YckC
MTLPNYPPRPGGGQQPYGQQPYYYGQRPGGPVFLPPSTPDGPRQDADVPVRVLSGPGRRLAARVLDTLIVLLGAGVIGGLGVVLGSVVGDLNEPDAAATVFLIIFGVLALVFLLLYEPVTTWKWGGTLGKLALGVRVVMVADGRGFPSLGVSFGRFLIQIVFRAVPLGGLLDVLWLTWDRPPYQRLHDKVVSTVVVRA